MGRRWGLAASPPPAGRQRGRRRQRVGSHSRLQLWQPCWFTRAQCPLHAPQRQRSSGQGWAGCDTRWQQCPERRAGGDGGADAPSAACGAVGGRQGGNARPQRRCPPHAILPAVLSPRAPPTPPCRRPKPAAEVWCGGARPGRQPYARAGAVARPADVDAASGRGAAAAAAAGATSVWCGADSGPVGPAQPAPDRS